MSVIGTGVIRGGQLVIDGDEPLPEGRRFTVIIESEEGLILSEEDKRDLREAMNEIERGEYVTKEQLLAELKRLK